MAATTAADVVRGRTRFTDWDEMRGKAAEEYAARLFDAG